jgi:hypothetical protein
MGMRVALAKSATATSGANSDGAMPSIKIRIQDPPWLFQTSGGYTGTVKIQHSVDGPEVTDANATWYDLITALSTNNTADVKHPLYRVRANCGGVTGSTGANVYMVEYVRALRAYPARDNEMATEGDFS